MSITTRILLPLISKAACARELHCSSVQCQIHKRTRMRVVDNSAVGKAAMMEGKPPMVIHIYARTPQGHPGDRVLLTIKGEMKKGIIVGCHQEQPAFRPKFDSNNVVLVDDNGSPLGTRIHAPIPTFLRKKLKDMSRAKGADYTKLLSIATKFV